MRNLIANTLASLAGMIRGKSSPGALAGQCPRWLDTRHRLAAAITR
jgi:hypothetical protein